MKLSDFTEEQRAFIGGLCFEATMQERERCAEALRAAREYIVEDRGGEPSPTDGPQVDYATLVLDKIDAAIAAAPNNRN